MGRRIFIDLSDVEDANIGGWVNKGLADPQFAAYPWRIVLEERTQARFDQIAAQFGAVPPPTLPVQVLKEFRPGDPRFVFEAIADVISAIPFVVAPGPYTVTSMIQATAGEYGWGGTAFGKAAINRQPGDMTGAQGGNSSIMILRDALPDGDGLWYYNLVLDPGSQPRGTGFSVTFPR